MGGNALKHLGTVRLNAHLYKLLTDDIQASCLRLLGRTPELIKSYRKKESFGDADFLLESDGLQADWVQTMEVEFDSKGSVSNGGVVSMEVAGFQVDFITRPKHEMLWAETYFGYNDLGNLMGRIAHKMGFKYGHDGLTKVVRSENHVIGEIKIPAGPDEVFSFMDYHHDVWRVGFDTLEEIFEYAASSIFFDPAIYLLDNRNHTSRTRDAKRPTYTAFLEWCKSKNGTFNWEAEEKAVWHDYFLTRAFERWPSVKEQYLAIKAEETRLQNERILFNGQLVMEWTGAQGKELGALLTKVKDAPTFNKYLKPYDMHGLKNLTENIYKEMMEQVQ